MTPNWRCDQGADPRRSSPAVKDIKNAQSLVKSEGINVLVSIGGGSPVDSGKAIAYFIQDEKKDGQFMPHIAVPTTLSAAELTQ